LDLLASRYGDMAYVMSLPPRDFLELVAEAAEARREEWARRQWLALLPWMSEKNFIPFERFYQRIKVEPASVKWRPREAVLADVEAIRRAVKGA